VINPDNFARKARLLATAAPFALVLGATPAFAQQAPAAQATVQDTQAAAEEDKDIVVTGSLFRRTDTETPSPVTVLSADALAKRGVNTVQDAIQRLSANGAGTLPNSFSANGAFASGASAVSLRGLTVSSTLVLFDGLRAAYYPLADDGTRNFVDLNTIPNAIIDRIEVLKDGASSTYGADAVAGVVNIITKKQIVGLHVNASAGISEQGDAGEQRFDATYGFGDLSEKGFNFYVSGEYQKNSQLFNRDRGYPYNTSDLSQLCGRGIASTSCRTNAVANGIQYDGTFAGVGTTTVAVVRPYTAPAAGTVDPFIANTAAIAGGQYSILGAGCGSLTPVTLNAAQQAANPTVNLRQCQEDPRMKWGVIAPEQERIGGTARATVQIGENSSAYAMFNYYRSNVYYDGTPQLLRANSAPGGVAYSTANLALPVYVCAARVNCTAANGTLNPNNPFAAQGQVARILYRIQDIPLSNRRLTQTYRGALGINGSLAEGWDYSIEGTAMKQNLEATYKGYINVQHLFDVVADGSYNFVNPALNSQATRDYLTPTVINKSSSEMYQGQASISHSFFDLPGGPLQVGIGGAVRNEKVTAPSANPVNNVNKYNRFFTINGFGTSGSRTVYSGYFEINAPIVEQLEVNVSGRYDDYSSGQTNFSPKIGAKFTPIKQIAIRGTYSRGFRIPSFAEAYGLPTTGFITATPPTNYQNSPACLNPANQKYAYCTNQYSIGLTSVGNPNLKPEKARNFTAGIIVEPVPNISFSVDYYNIKKTDLITGADYAPQVASYYASATAAGTALAPGITGITQDANYIPGQGPYALLSTVQYGFINADSQKSTGIDFTAEGRFNLTDSIRWTTSLEGTYVIELSQTIGGVKQRYDGTLGPYQTTSASGTPKWRGSWQNTLEIGKATVSATAYYTSGYELGAEDDGNVRGVCAPTGAYALYRDGSVVLCRTKSFINVDMTASYKVDDKFTFYVNMLNAFGAKAPYDPSTYGGSNYNPAWANSGIIGRYFRVGAKVDF
jgi:iron complex outermembrane receptor protein